MVTLDADDAAYLVTKVGYYEYVDVESDASKSRDRTHQIDYEVVLDGTVPDVKEALETGAYDDVLDDMGSAEAARDERIGVKRAIDRRREETR